MSASLVLGIIAGYFGLLLLIAFYTSRNSNQESFFTGNRNSPWYVVAFGMIGASLSGVTFISVPGQVVTAHFSYMQVVMGYLPGYMVIAFVLMPLYYRLQLVSIYGYLEERFGFFSYKTGAFFFLISRTFGASARLYLAATVLQLAIFDAWHIPFAVTVAITILLIWVYTFKGGIKTVVWTDTLQTATMLITVVITIYFIAQELNYSFSELVQVIYESPLSNIWITDTYSAHFWLKDVLSGALIAMTMTGLDQDMMQKNLTCRNLKDAQKNMIWFTITLLFVNLLFLCLGATLYLYATANAIEIPARTDTFFPMLALNHFSTWLGVLFIIGVIAAAYSSADSALTALTTSFCYDFLNFKHQSPKKRKYISRRIHIAFSVMMFVVIVLFQWLNSSDVITAVLSIAGYTYGPLLGLFVFGMLSNKSVTDKFVPLVCVASPLLCFVLQQNSEKWFGGYKIGFELIALNGFLTVLGLWVISKVN